MSNSTGLIAIGLGALALGVAIAVFLSFASVRRRVILLQGRNGQADILEAVSRQVEEVRALRGEIRKIAQQLGTVSAELRLAMQRFAVYRYDAFEDMGGKMSFSAAFLNAQGDGVVISCINGRQEARTYAKPVLATRSDFNLSPEEQEAVRMALQGEVSR